MQEVSSPQPHLIVPLWARIGLAALMFLNAILNARKPFVQFEWVPWFCMGAYWLVSVPRQKGETLSAYVMTPRGIASIAFLTAALVGFGHSLVFKHSLFFK
jgi:hypothetical protein